MDKERAVATRKVSTTSVCVRLTTLRQAMAGLTVFIVIPA